MNFNTNEIEAILQNFYDLLCGAEDIYNYYASELSRYNAMSTDYNHTIELGEFSYHELGKMQKEHINNLRKRRKAKDMVELYETFKNYAISSAGTSTRNNVLRSLESVKKVNEHHATRKYTLKENSNIGNKGEVAFQCGNEGEIIIDEFFKNQNKNKAKYM